MSVGSGIPETLLKQNCRPPVTCSYDKLKDRAQASVSDMNVFLLLLSGNVNRTIKYTWVSGSKWISIDVFFTALYGTWSFFEEAEIYVGKEMVTKVNGQVDRVVGYYNDVAGEYEKIERISGVISIEAEKNS